MKWIKDSAGKPSESTTILLFAIAIATVKLFMSDTFTASDWAIITGTAASFKWAKRNAVFGNKQDPKQHSE